MADMDFSYLLGRGLTLRQLAGARESGSEDMAPGSTLLSLIASGGKMVPNYGNPAPAAPGSPLSPPGPAGPMGPVSPGAQRYISLRTLMDPGWDRDRQRTQGIADDYSLLLGKSFPDYSFLLGRSFQLPKIELNSIGTFGSRVVPQVKARTK